MTVVGKARAAVTGALAASVMAIAAVSPAGATYESGLQAYKTGQYQLAVDLWQKYAVAGDVRSMKILGDFYSGEAIEKLPNGELPVNLIQEPDNTKALYWYTLAAVHDFQKELKQPTAFEVGDKILAHNRLPEIRSRMKTAEVKAAEDLVAQKFESGSTYDLYRLGEMYQKGLGVSKNNTRAFQMYALAMERGGVPEAGTASAKLETILTKTEIDAAIKNADSWQPPLPPEHTGQTKQQKELERLRKELEEIQMAKARQAVSDIDVELIQRALKVSGFRPGVIDNNLGPSTRAAIKRFQSSLVALDTEMTPAEKEDVKTGVLTAKQTVDLFRNAATRAGDPMSQYVYGIMHVRGIGVSQDGEQALSWLNEAADADLAIGHYALGVIYRDGTTGLNEVEPNASLSALHFARASALGYSPAYDALHELSFENPRDIQE